MTDVWSSRIVRALACLAALTAVGTVGYMMIEGWSFSDALFMTAVILSTVGLESPHPLSAAGRAFTIGLIATGVTIAAYLVSVLGEYVTAGVLTGAFRRRRLQRAISRVSEHFIVCGYGRVGRQVAADLRRRGRQVVIVEPDGAAVDDLQDVPILSGDATEDDVLIRAGVRRAHGIVAGTGADATNLVITLSARSLNPDLVIVARASEPSAESKLTRAGATHVISPYAIGGHRIVSELLSPGISAFLDTVVHADHVDLWLEVTTIAAGSALVGHTVDEALRPSKAAVNLVAFRHGVDGPFVTNPPADLLLAAGDTLVAIGPRAAMQHLGTQALGTDRTTQTPVRTRLPRSERVG